MSHRRISCKYYLSHAAIFTLLGCGGGSESVVETPKIIAPILVNAGQNISVVEETSVTLNGNASGGDGILTYTWQSSPTITITDDDTSEGSASFIAPTLRQATDYELTLTVADENGNTGQDAITVSVSIENALPLAQIDVMQAELYAENTYPVLTEITLDGLNSSDDDPQDTEQASLSYEWQQLSGEPLLDDVLLTGSSLVFTSNLSQIDYQASFSLTVNDQDGATDSQSVTLFFLAESKTLPTISADTPPTVLGGERINLSALAASPAPGAYPFDIAWTDDFGESLRYDNNNLEHTYAVAPNVEEATDIQFSVTAVDQYGNPIETSVTARVLPYTFETLNDTGVFLDANETVNTALYQSEYAGQDAHRGKDVIHANNQSRKAGRGEQGFDFTRLDENGAELDDDARQASCVRDNTTALIWQVKTNVSGDISEGAQLFTWFNDDENGGFEGFVNAGSAQCNVQTQTCNIQAYKEQINTQGLCGFFDWRIPTPLELTSLLHYGKTEAPMIDTEYFPHMGDATQAPIWYWTLQSSADGVNEEDNAAQSVWVYDFASGVDAFLTKSEVNRVILVRAGRTFE